MIAVLTFLRARKTILQPLRTEVFKLQLDQMKEVLSIFASKTNGDLMDEFGIGLALTNARMLVSDYSEAFFDSPFMEDRDRPLIFRGAGHSSEIPIGENTKPLWPRRRYESMVGITGAFNSHTERVHQALGSPLLPSQCRGLLEEYLHALEGSVNTLIETLNRVACELPDRYPTEDKLNDAMFWIANQLISDIGNFDGHIRQIVEFCQMYYDPDEFAPVVRR